MFDYSDSHPTCCTQQIGTWPDGRCDMRSSRVLVTQFHIILCLRRPHWFRSNGASWSSAFLWSAEYLNAPCFSAQFCSPCIRRRPGCTNWRARSVSTSIRWQYPDLLFLFTVTRRWVIIDSMWTTGTAVMAQVYLCFVCVIKKTTVSMYRLC